MSKLIVCLGYHLQFDDSMSPILENRLKDTARLCEENKNSSLLLMGGFSYHELEKFKFSEAALMKEFLEKNFIEKIKNTKIIIEENTTSTVEQLCYLKKFIKQEQLDYSDLMIVSSKFFVDRVKLYVEYIFGINSGIAFIESDIPVDLEDRFRKIEEIKRQEVEDWFKGHQKGDDVTILKEQEVFQAKVKKGEIKRPIS
jgi:hypothetical protein